MQIIEYREKSDSTRDDCDKGRKERDIWVMGSHLHTNNVTCVQDIGVGVKLSSASRRTSIASALQKWVLIRYVVQGR